MSAEFFRVLLGSLSIFVNSGAQCFRVLYPLSGSHAMLLVID
jgi:hypothetical protein